MSHSEKVRARAALSSQPVFEWGSGRFGLDITRYPELVQFRAMLEADGDSPWIGR
jgi:hypothetical protein